MSTPQTIMHLDLALLYLDAEESSFPTPPTIMHLDLALLYLDAEESSFPTPQTIMHLDLALLYLDAEESSFSTPQTIIHLDLALLYLDAYDTSTVLSPGTIAKIRKRSGEKKDEEEQNQRSCMTQRLTGPCGLNSMAPSSSY